jgi:hypothetical protein
LALLESFTTRRIGAIVDKRAGARVQHAVVYSLSRRAAMSVGYMPTAVGWPRLG